MTESDKNEYRVRGNFILISFLLFQVVFVLALILLKDVLLVRHPANLGLTYEEYLDLIRVSAETSDRLRDVFMQFIELFRKIILFPIILAVLDLYFTRQNPYPVPKIIKFAVPGAAFILFALFSRYTANVPGPLYRAYLPLVPTELVTLVLGGLLLYGRRLARKSSDREN